MKTYSEVIRDLINYVDDNYRTTSLSELMDLTWKEWKAADLAMIPFLGEIRQEILSNYILNCAVHNVVPVTGYTDKMEGEP